MKKLTLLTIIFTAITSICNAKSSSNSNVTSGAKDFGAGIMLGDPTALTVKYWKDSQVAFDAGLSFSISDYFLFYGDYLFHYPGVFGRANELTAHLTPYFGLGGVFAMTTKDRTNENAVYGKKSGSFGLGLRIPLGIEWKPSRPSLGVFLEIAPGISILPSTSSLFQGGLGVRYYF